MCGRASSLRWVYRCTQDSDTFLPKSEFYAEEPKPYQSRLTGPEVTSELSQSVLSGIQVGDYDAQQVRLLRAQKLRVKEVIALQEEGLEDQSDSSRTSSSHSTSDSTLDTLSQIPPEIPEVLLHPNTVVYSQAATKGAVDQVEAPSARPSATNKINTEHVVPECIFKCCHSCRPAFRDRAFQSLDAILREPFKQPPPWELENRRISDADLLTTIGSPPPPQELRRMYQTLDDSRDLTGSRTFESSEDEEIDSTTNKQKKNVRRRSGFREAVRKALDSIEQSKYIAKSSKHSSRSSSRSSFIRMSPSMLFERRKNQAKEKGNQIVSNKALQESLVLMLAVNTPLPRASEDADSLDGGEVKVEDGVAVTEEAVGMSAADIIMQA